MYQLDPGYTEDSDNDVQNAANDELLPVNPRSQILTDAMALTGIVPFFQTPLQSVDLGAGRTTYNLTPNGGEVQLPSGIGWDHVIIAVGNLGIQITDSDTNPVDPKDYRITDGGIKFVNAEEQPPSGAHLSCYQTAASPAQDWALQGNDLYVGTNKSFNNLLIQVEDGDWESGTATGSEGDHVHTSMSVDSVKATYAYVAPFSKYFCGDHANWVSEHLWLRPDVFVGTTDYPGDASVVDNVPYEPGPVPEFVPPDEYALNARDGLVTFLTEVDSVADAVRANYSHYTDIDNVTGQSLDVVSGTGGLVYKSDTETAYPSSHGKRWIRHKSLQMPMTIYVNGEIAPKTQTVLPYDTLTPITG